MLEAPKRKRESNPQNSANDVKKVRSSPGGALSNISNELIMHFLSFLDPKSLANMGTANYYFHRMVNCNYIWRSLLRQDFPAAEKNAPKDFNVKPKKLYIQENDLIKKYKKIKTYFPDLEQALVIDALRGKVENFATLPPTMMEDLYFIAAINGNKQAQKTISLQFNFPEEFLLKMLEVAFKIGDFDGLTWLWPQCSRFVLGNSSYLYQLMPRASHLNSETFSWLWDQLDEEVKNLFTCRIFINACIEGNIELVKFITLVFKDKIEINQGFCLAAQRKNTDIMKWMLQNAKVSSQAIERVLTGNVFLQNPYPRDSIEAIKEFLAQQSSNSNDEKPYERFRFPFE